MGFSVGILKSLKKIDEAITVVQEKKKEFSNAINQAWKEIEDLNSKICEIVPIPDVVSEMGIKSQDLMNKDFLSSVTSNISQVSDIMEMAQNLSKQSPESIVSNVISLQFKVPSDTFTEQEHILEILRNSASKSK